MTSPPPPCPARTATTLYSYAQRLAAEQAPRAAALLLGLRWCFGFPSTDLCAIQEYDLPLNPTPLAAALARRGGLQIVAHEGDGEASLYEHLAAGRPAIVAADVFYFPFRPAYRRIHSSRAVLALAGLREGRAQIWDGWRPAAEGVVSHEELRDARFSEVPLDLEREALFAGRPLGGRWYSVEATPQQVEDAAAWARERLGWLYDEMATARADARGEYGIAALQKFRVWLAGRLSAQLAEEEVIALRRGASLLLRPELSSRLYLGVFLRNAAHLVGDGALQDAVALYRQRLGHLQAAMDALTKTVRTRRPEYDDFIVRELGAACDNEEHLLAALAPHGDRAGPPASAPGRVHSP